MDAAPYRRVEYPESDGKPMGETEFHVSAILYLRQALVYHFRKVGNVYVGTDMFLYYEKGNPAAVVAPDVFVARGVSKHKRRTFKMWEEEAGPCTVIEVTSRESRLEDLGTKRVVYETLGVREYFLFDPLGEYLKPQLRGFVLRGEQFEPLEPAPGGVLRSRELGLLLRPEADVLRLVVEQTGEMLPDLGEAMQRAETATHRAEAEAQRAEAEAQRAEAEAQRAEAEAQRAEAEAQRADRAERELARLRAEIGRTNKSSR